VAVPCSPQDSRDIVYIALTYAKAFVLNGQDDSDVVMRTRIEDPIIYDDVSTFWGKLTILGREIESVAGKFRPVNPGWNPGKRTAYGFRMLVRDGETRLNATVIDKGSAPLACEVLSRSTREVVCQH